MLAEALRRLRSDPPLTQSYTYVRVSISSLFSAGSSRESIGFIDKLIGCIKCRVADPDDCYADQVELDTQSMVDDLDFLLEVPFPALHSGSGLGF